MCTRHSHKHNISTGSNEQKLCHLQSRVQTDWQSERLHPLSNSASCCISMISFILCTKGHLGWFVHKWAAKVQESDDSWLLKHIGGNIIKAPLATYKSWVRVSKIRSDASLKIHFKYWTVWWGGELLSETWNFFTALKIIIKQLIFFGPCSFKMTQPCSLYDCERILRFGLPLVIDRMLHKQSQSVCSKFVFIKGIIILSRTFTELL